MPWIIFGEEFCKTYVGDVTMLTSKISPPGHQHYIIVASKHLQLTPRPHEYTFLSWPTNPIVSNWQVNKDIYFEVEPFWFIVFPMLVPCVGEWPLGTQWTKKVLEGLDWQGTDIGSAMNQKRSWKTRLDEIFIHHGWAITSNAVTPKVPYLYHWYLGFWSISPFFIHIIFKVTNFHLSKYCFAMKSIHLWKDNIDFFFNCEKIMISFARMWTPSLERKMSLHHQEN